MVVAIPVGRDPIKIQFFTVLLDAPVVPVVLVDERRIIAVIFVEVAI